MSLRTNRLSILLSLVALLSAPCSSSLLKPPAAKVSPFLDVRELPIQPARDTGPFALAGGVPRTVAKSLYIAPVALTHLRPPSKHLSRMGSESSRLKEAHKIAGYGQRQFTSAFKTEPQSVYKVDETRRPKGATLQLAITELNRNTIVGALGRLTPNALRVPGLGPVLSLSGATRPLKASIAIEGKLIENQTGRVVYQFADVAESKQALLPITDFAAYGQARQAMRDWARSFEKVTRAGPRERVKGVRVISLF
jgi:Protein of unknown function (DUF3313)